LPPESSLRGGSSGSQRLVHGVCKPTVHPLDHVAVGVEGDAYAGVPQKLLHVLGMLARHEEYRCAGVAEIMKYCFLLLSVRMHVEPLWDGRSYSGSWT
jgi:hypothetical protein